MPIDKFLIVDEVEAHALFFSVVLNDLGIKDVATATTGEDALALAQKTSFHFIIAAWEMRTMPGTVFVQRFRSQGKRKHVPYLIYSKRMSEQDATLAHELGLGNVLTLPLDKEKAKSAIKALIDAENAVTAEEQKLRKIESYNAENRPNEALKLFDGRLRGKGPHFVRAQTALGNLWLLTAAWDKAEESLNGALAEDPKHWEAANLLANVYSRTGRHDEAIALLNRMADASPKNIGTLLSLSSTYVEADRPEDARQVIARIGTLDPDAPGLAEEKGKLAFKDGDLPLAAKLLAETQNGDALARYFNNLAIGLVGKQKFDEAIETYENAIKLLLDKAKLHALHYNLGLALAKKGLLPRSFHEFGKSYLADPTFVKAYTALARTAKQMTEQGLAYDKQLAKEVNQLHREQKAKDEKEGNSSDGGKDKKAPTTGSAA